MQGESKRVKISHSNSCPGSGPGLSGVTRSSRTLACTDLIVCSHNRISSRCAECQIAALTWCMKTGGPNVSSDIEEFVLDRLTWAPVRDSFIMSVEHGSKDWAPADFFVGHEQCEDQKMLDFLFHFEGTEEEYAGFIVGFGHFHGFFEHWDDLFRDNRRDSFIMDRFSIEDPDPGPGIQPLKTLVDKFPYVLSIGSAQTSVNEICLYGANNKEEFLSGFLVGSLPGIPTEMFYAPELVKSKVKAKVKASQTICWREKDGRLKRPDASSPNEILKRTKCTMCVRPLGVCIKVPYIEGTDEDSSESDN